MKRKFTNSHSGTGKLDNASPKHRNESHVCSTHYTRTSKTCEPKTEHPTLIVQEKPHAQRIARTNHGHSNTPEFRELLILWISEVHNSFCLSEASFYLAVNILDRVCSLMPVEKSELDLVGITSLVIASKFEDLTPLSMHQCAEYQFTLRALIHKEREILECLRFEIYVPTVYNRFISLAGLLLAPSSTTSIGEAILKKMILSTDVLQYHSSFLAAFALLCGSHISKNPIQTNKILEATKCKMADIRPFFCIAKKIQDAHRSKNSSPEVSLLR